MTETTPRYDRKSNIRVIAGNTEVGVVQRPDLLVRPSASTGGAIVERWWVHYQEQLADWTYNTLLNRSDVFGAYCSLNSRKGGSKSYTAPAEPERRFRGALTLGRVKQHFCGLRHEHLIGIHAISQGNTSRWLAIDIDQHNDTAGPTVQANLRAAGHWHHVLSSMGLRPLLLDSNGNGGFHLWVIFNAPIPTWVVHHFGQTLISDFAELGLSERPETFPKQASLSESCKYGNWLRLPGRHHTRDHWTQVWYDGSWLACDRAIRHLLGATGDDTDIVRRWLSANPQKLEQQRTDTAKPIRRKGKIADDVPNATVEAPANLCLATRQFLLGLFKDGPGWNQRLFAAACDMSGNGFSLNEAMPLLLGGAVPYDSDEEQAARRTIDSAFAQERVPARPCADPKTPGVKVGEVEVEFHSTKQSTLPARTEV